MNQTTVAMVFVNLSGNSVVIVDTLSDTFDKNHLEMFSHFVDSGSRSIRAVYSRLECEFAVSPIFCLFLF